MLGIVFLLFLFFRKDTTKPSIPYTAEKTQANLDPSQNTTNNINTNTNNLETATQNEITNTTPNEIEEPQEAIPSPEVEIASFSTPLKSKANGRRHNIELTASILDGTIIGPGETFSFNQVVGKPSSARGYEEADVLVDGETTQAIGGR